MNSTTPDGAPTAPFAHVFQQVADCLIYSGAALAVFAMVVWMLAGWRGPGSSKVAAGSE